MTKGLIISGERERTRDELFARASRLSTGFDHLGIGPGDSVALMLRNDFPFLEATVAVGRLGGHAVPINWHFLADEAEHILRDSAAKAIVVHADLLPQIEAALKREKYQEELEKYLAGLWEKNWICVFPKYAGKFSTDRYGETTTCS